MKLYSKGQIEEVEEEPGQELVRQEPYRDLDGRWWLKETVFVKR